MNEWQQLLISNYLRKYRSFKGWDGQMVVGYYRQYLHSKLSEIEITEAVLEANRQLREKLEMSLHQTKLVRFGDLPNGTGFYRNSLFFIKELGASYNTITLKGVRIIFEEDVMVSISQ